jgi:hypothetical protein
MGNEASTDSTARDSINGNSIGVNIGTAQHQRRFAPKKKRVLIEQQNGRTDSLDRLIFMSYRMIRKIFIS